MDEEFEMSERVVRVMALRLNWADFAVAAATTIRGIHAAFTDGFEYLEGAFLAHSAAIAERQEFEKTAGREIEALSEVKDA